MLVPDQPPPTPGTGDVWAELINEARGTEFERLIPMMAERRQLGIDRYGTPLQRDNGRDHLVDACQELLDAAVYFRAAGRRDAADRALALLAEVTP